MIFSYFQLAKKTRNMTWLLPQMKVFLNFSVKRYLLLFCIILSLPIVMQAQSDESDLASQLKYLGLAKIGNKYSPANTTFVLKLWDSLNNYHHDKMYDLLPANEWEKILNNFYLNAREQKDTVNAIRIAYPLCFVLHTQAKFNYGITVLEFLYNNKYKLKKYQYKSVLIKLEEEYRYFKNMPMVIKTRNERIQNKFIKTFWEIYATCGLYEEAINDFKLFEPIPKLANRDRLKYFMRLADLFFDANQFDSAQKYYKIGVAETDYILKKNKESKEIVEGDYVYMRGWFIGLIGNCYIEKGNLKEAVPLLEYYLSVSKGGYKVNSMLPLSKCYLALGQIKKCKNYLDKCRDIITGTAFEKSSLGYFQTKSNYHQAIKQYDSALYYLQLYDLQKNSFVTNILKNQSSLLLAKLEIEKRRKELSISQKELFKSRLISSEQKIQLYLAFLGLASLGIISIILLISRHQRNKNKKVIEQKNIQLEEYAQKNLQKSKHNEQLVKELHHRVKNNLQNIYSLLNIQKRRISDQSNQAFIDSIQNRINSMAIVHENLYNADDFELIEFENYLKNLVFHLQLSYQKDDYIVSFEYDIAPVSICLEKVILLGLIINETISNAFKYALVKGQLNIMTIALHRSDKICTLTIKDNGPGFKKELVTEKSLGLKLIQTMCLQLDANYIIDTSSGVEHKITFNL